MAKRTNDAPRGAIRDADSAETKRASAFACWIAMGGFWRLRQAAMLDALRKA